MKRYMFAIIVGVGLVIASSLLPNTRPIGAQTQQSTAVFESDGKLKLPDPATFRRWVFVGAPLTPNGLNNGKAGFPEYHHVYIEAKNVDAHLKTGSFTEETKNVKELTRDLYTNFKDAL